MKRTCKPATGNGLLLVAVFTFFLAGLSACGIVSGKKLYGDPTSIPEGQSPVDVIKAIQTEFRQLDKPILRKIKYHQQWKKRRFADSTYTYGPFSQVILTREAYNFYKKHTPREIFTAVTPLLFDPEIGGEVTVLLSGIPVKNLELASSIHLGNLLVEMGYTSPDNQGTWDIKSYRGSSYIGYPGIFHDAYEKPVQGTLDYAIYSVLKDEYSVRNHPGRDYFEPFAAGLDGKTFKTLDEFIKTGLKPEPSEKFAQFLAAHSDLFSSTVLLASVRNNTIALMWSLDLEDRFWPLAVDKAVFDHTPFRMDQFKRQMEQMEADFLQTAGEEVYQASNAPTTSCAGAPLWHAGIL